jgi:threonine dehydratase
MLSGVARATAMEGSRHLSQLVGAPVHLKCENLQRTGSFKLRGAYVRIAGLLPEERAAGVVAASAGNHAQGVALASSLLGVRSTVFMPKGAPLPKISATREYGAEVRLEGQVVDETLAAAQEYAERTGAVLIHPFDHPDVVAGQGTVGLEIMADGPAPDAILVQAGGGGLLSGIAVAVKALHPETLVIGVEPEGADVVSRSLEAGHPVEMKPVSIADGLCGPIGGVVTMPIIAEKVDRVIRVPDDAIRQAMRLFAERTKLVVEPAGAAGLAPFVAGLVDLPENADVVLVATGGNIDATLLATYLGG